MRADDVLPTLRRHLLVDGFDLVLDLERSSGSRIVDARDGTTYLDMFSFFASNALGMNHPALTSDEASEQLLQAVRTKPSNSDIYSAPQAAFVDAFERVLGVDGLPYAFLVEGGALGVENCLKAAFDWKSRTNERAGRSRDLGTRVLHLRHAFHGRTGYTMSLTNTDPSKTDRFPQFDWPRIPSPALRFPLEKFEAENAEDEAQALAAARRAFEDHPHDIAAFITEPIQSEGGDRHLSASFLLAMQELCLEHDALFILDEIQTGVGMTGSAWCFQQLGLTPDLVAFGKKTHVCGMMGGGRLDEIDDHVWKVSSRINSTFGGSLADMVRARLILETIERDDLMANAGTVGGHLLAGLEAAAASSPLLSNARGRGLLCAVDLPDGHVRDKVIGRLFEHEHVILIGCGDRTVRFRPTLTATSDEVDEALSALLRATDYVGS